MRSVDEWLEHIGRAKLLSALRPGIPSDSVRSRLGEISLASARELESLYAWHDGTELPADGIVDDFEIIPGFYFLSLGDAVALRAANLAENPWKNTWLPILTDGAGYHYVVDLNGEPDPVVRRWEFDEADQPVAFMSITNLVLTIEQGYSRGVFFVDERGYLSMDQYQFEAMAAELNPGADAWYKDLQ